MAGLLFAGCSLVFDVLEWRSRRLKELPLRTARHTEQQDATTVTEIEESAPAHSTAARETEDGEPDEPHPARAVIHFTHIAAYLALFVVMGFTVATAIYFVLFLWTMTQKDHWRVRLLAIVGLSALAVVLTIALTTIAGQPI